MAILVTGGLGYIGSHTVVELIQNNFDVVIIDDLSNTEKNVLDGIEKITGVRPVFYPFDLKRRELLTQVLEAHKIEGCIHFAAYKAVGESQEKPVDYYENNLFSLINILQEFKEKNISNFIFSSSCTVYGQADEMPINEDTPLKLPESSYGKTKQMGEEIIKDFATAHHKKVSLLRYFNPIGAHPSSLIGELPLGVPNNLIPYVSQTAAGIREQLSIFGDDYPTPDGTAIRDYIYVVDLAKAHVASLKKLISSDADTVIDIFNLGTGKGSSVLEVVKGFETANDVEVKYEFKPRRAGDITIAYANASRAEQELGWKAATSLEEALKTTWQWQKYLESRDK
ncbi:UDP-glucose 4-epimerase GalE [Elizabethkingia meningoseptica]|uniref:UDP-glucose 4-epimerase n=1 Tax=Elizabethkingia meningoseptica TaxID=238 RepID=A0A1V3U0V2_ELIME|nr:MULTISPECIES: UDP-glucose 4-epimerase GalE [Elizabethkingia]AQX06067.1 UDP-glucose 4-epimerase GalE [Elizabethkingia meningoseptica]AQX13608.1 UDP-glucose 4-epimerase GalE [Elizabethkingia meningoseptica]AQX48113.1 UDP-glucose 4-epimerase [Elizabethkingia meningoseptica]EJK5327498.1 UDP-glucose 4-epimerase GalE [Elizabethkingia meningoseptica]EOR31041.1 UDP-glucose 4-epimerase [Elizabethkingia meningoseptica ATCC 13253 = NBRC 12535]